MIDRLLEWGARAWDALGPTVGVLALAGIGLYCLLTLIGGDD